MTFSIGGLATGLDTKSIVDQMIQIDSRPKVKLEWNKALWEARRSTWSDLNTRLNALQGYANKVMDPASWTVFSGITSSDNTRITGTSVGSKPQSGTHSINVSQLASVEQWDSSIALAGATAGVRTSGTWYKAGLAQLTGADLLTSTRSQTDVSVGLNNNSTITMSWNEGGQLNSSTFNVTATSRFSDLAAWAQSQIPGSTVSISAGKLEVTSPAGTDGEVTSLSFTARNAAGTVLNRFNGSLGAQTSMTTAATDGGVATADTLQIVQGSSSWYVNVAQGDNMAAIASKINATSGIGVTASIVSGNLRLTSNSSGAAGDVAVSSTGGLAGAIGLAETTNGQDASFTVNGTAYTRSKNTGITDVLTDVSLDLLNTTATAVDLTVGQAAATPDEIKKKIKDFVTQYNEIIDFVGAKTAEQKVASPKSLGEYLQGPLARDFNFSSIAFQMRSKVTDLVAGQPAGYQTLADIGISTGAIGSGDRSGKLVIDESKLDAALSSNQGAVRDLFMKAGAGTGITADDGVARKMSELVSQLRTGGSVDSGMQGASNQIKGLQDSIARLTERLDRRKSYYTRMFNAMEGSVGRMQQQSNWLSGQLSSLSQASFGS